MLIDTNGKIAFKGHPANRKDLVADFNALLKGETLEGEGCAPKEAAADAGADAEPEAKEGYKSATDDEIAAMNAEMTRFKETGKQLQADCKEKATGMMRNFCVLTLDASMSPKTMNWQVQYMNHRVLVGPKEKVDHCNDKIKEKMTDGWTFELNE